VASARANQRSCAGSQPHAKSSRVSVKSDLNRADAQKTQTLINQQTQETTPNRHLLTKPQASKKLQVIRREMIDAHEAKHQPLASLLQKGGNLIKGSVVS